MESQTVIDLCTQEYDSETQQEYESEDEWDITLAQRTPKHIRTQDTTQEFIPSPVLFPSPQQKSKPISLSDIEDDTWCFLQDSVATIVISSDEEEGTSQDRDVVPPTPSDQEETLPLSQDEDVIPPTPPATPRRTARFPPPPPTVYRPPRERRGRPPVARRKLFHDDDETLTATQINEQYIYGDDTTDSDTDDDDDFSMLFTARRKRRYKVAAALCSGRRTRAMNQK